jgi:hypothetical protein
VRAECKRFAVEAHDYAYRLTGWDRGPTDSPDLAERYLAACGEMEKRNGHAAHEKELDTLFRKLDRLMREIMCTPAMSIAGLRVKTLAAIEVNNSLWNKPARDLDYDKRGTRSLIEAACTLTQILVPQKASGDIRPRSRCSPPTFGFGCAQLIRAWRGCPASSQ